MLKTPESGYDGKGQILVDLESDSASVWQSLACSAAVLEQFVDIDCEFSIVAARDASGAVACYDPIRNVHRNHILDLSSSPAGRGAQQASEAREIAEAIMRGLHVQGVLCVEFFLTRDGCVLVNELAPRPHNSGHLTMDAHATCQFEQQLRTVCGQGVGPIQQLCPVAMANLLGDLWSHGGPNWPALAQFPQVKHYDYGKMQARSGRKMGHMTCFARSVDVAIATVQRARESLAPGEGRMSRTSMHARSDACKKSMDVHP